MLFDATKVHDILDDLESLYWVLLYIGIHYFRYSGHIEPEVFDEYSLRIHPVFGQISCGGRSKHSWLHTPGVVFECRALNKFLSDYATFHSDYFKLIEAAKKDETKQGDLDSYRDRIQTDIYGLMSYFDVILDGPEEHWDKYKVAVGSSKRPSAEIERKGMNSAVENAIFGLYGREEDSASEEDMELNHVGGCKSGTSRGKKRSRKGPKGSRYRRKVDTIPEDRDEDDGQA